MTTAKAPHFVRGQTYIRRRDIHAHFKGNQQAGIAPSKDHPFIFLFTGDAGEAYGYSDTWKDGLFLYSGEGQIGDQKMTNGNKAILQHAENGKELLLFTKVATAKVRFEGIFHCVGWEELRGKDREGSLRKLIVFHLKPEEGIHDTTAILNTEPENSKTPRPLDELRKRAYVAAQAPKTTTTSKESARIYYERSSLVRDYVLARADGHCECCGIAAPFTSKTGSPYLEAHHIHRLSDRGLDDPRHVAGICPTCHRRIHHGKDGALLDNKLESAIQEKETSIQFV